MLWGLVAPASLAEPIERKKMNLGLSANSTLSHYGVVSKIGAGGMGEVWLAEDTRLKRNVAIKLLPAELTADGDRVRRFEQEAQAASALNHPNIVTVYDMIQVPGSHRLRISGTKSP